MKQVELAQRLGVSRAYISMLAKGERKPSKKLQRKLQKLTKECSLSNTISVNGVQVVGGSNPLTPRYKFSDKSIGVIKLRELAEKIEGNHSYVAKIENGRQRGSYKTLVKLAVALDLPVDLGLIKAFNIPNRSNEDLELTLEGIEFLKLNPKVKTLLLKLAPTLAQYID